MSLTLEETLDMVVRKADAMRDKGILEFEGAGIHLRLAPKDPPQAPTSVVDDEDEESPVDPLDDKDTFGGVIPRRRGAPMKDSSDE